MQRCMHFHHRHKKKKHSHVYEQNENRRRRNRGSVSHTGHKTAKTVTGGGISIFSPTQEEQEDSQEGFQTVSGVLIGWRNWWRHDRLMWDPKTRQNALMMCECINIFLGSSCHQKAPIIIYLYVVGTNTKSKAERRREPQQEQPALGYKRNTFTKRRRI